MKGRIIWPQQAAPEQPNPQPKQPVKPGYEDGGDSHTETPEPNEQEESPGWTREQDVLSTCE
jgi:hypothetical protein